MKNNKVVSATIKGISVNYTDTKKHYFINYEKISNNVKKNIITKNYDDIPKLNVKQLKLYRIAIYGVEALSEAEKSTISFKEKFNIEKNKIKTQKNINRWKQEISCKIVDNILSKLFPNSKLVLEIGMHCEYYSDDYINKFSFKELGINRKSIIDKLIEFQSLPENFYSIK